MAKAQVTVRLDKDQLARAKKALGVETITKTIEQALALATEKATHDKVLRKYSGVGGKDSFAER
jgi:Arc/MetJ family transcription regulator